MEDAGKKLHHRVNSLCKYLLCNMDTDSKAVVTTLSGLTGPLGQVQESQCSQVSYQSVFCCCFFFIAIYYQGGHDTGKTGNLVLTFSRQGKHREFCCDTGKKLETQGNYFDCDHKYKKYVYFFKISKFFSLALLGMNLKFKVLYPFPPNTICAIFTLCLIILMHNFYLGNLCVKGSNSI